MTISASPLLLAGSGGRAAVDVVRNAANRIAVALGAGEAHVADGVAYFAVDAGGALTYGHPVPGTSETV